MSEQRHGKDIDGVVLIGAGGHAVVVAETVIGLGGTIAGVLDDNATPRACENPIGAKRLGALLDLAAVGALSWVVGVGDVQQRRTVLSVFGPVGGACCPLVHPQGWVSGSANLRHGAWIGPGAIIHSCVCVGAHVLVNSGSIIEHDVVIGENTHIGPGAVVGGTCTIGADSLIGLGSRILPGVRIGDGAVVGAGAVVLDDVRSGSRVVGVPARELG